MDKIIKVTKLYDNNNSISKEITWKNGRLHKKSNASVSDGYFATADFDFNGFVFYLSSMERNECLVLGKPKKLDSGRVASSSELHHYDSTTICRTKANFT